MVVWMIRHGQTDWNLMGKWQGQSIKAPGLNAKGKEQVVSALDQFPTGFFSAIYSSDLLRAKQTADLIGNHLDLPVSLDIRLREMNLGAWEGMLFDEIEAQYPQEIEERKQNPVTAHAPDGESLQDVANRVITAVHEIALKHPKDPVLIVSHGIALAVIACYGKKMALANAYDHIPENMKILRMEWS